MSLKTETRLLVADDWEDYALLDSGNLQKLERFASQTVIRPDPQAFWEPARPVQSWKADARFVTKAQDEDGAGQWELLSARAAESWPMRWNGLTFTARRTAFRHMGVFQEHSVHWRWAMDQVSAARRPVPTRLPPRGHAEAPPQARRQQPHRPGQKAHGGARRGRLAAWRCKL